MTQAPDALFTPNIRLSGEVNDAMLERFQDQFAKARDGSDPIVVELTTLGGDADVGRRIADDIRLFRSRTGRRPIFFGKTSVYSAGASIMGAFLRQDRWLESQCVLMVHSRKLAKTIDFSHFLAAERDRIKALLAEIDMGLKVQTWGFEQLIEGSDVPLKELEERAQHNWYLTAEEALERKLVAGVV